MMKAIVIGLGQMGKCHALALHNHPDVELLALINRSSIDLPTQLKGYLFLKDFEEGLSLQPDLVVIATHPESHADYACAAMAAGCHVFVEKPLALTVSDAQRVIHQAKICNRKLLVGYILRYHTSWVRLIKEARTLAGPYVFRLNLNQQSTGEQWEVHKALLKTTSPIVDCGVHYVDVMCQITDAKPLRVHGMGLRLSDEIALDMYNYGQFQVVFDDGSVGWYEAGWGPMISETAFFVKDIIATNGSVSITQSNPMASADIDGHTQVGGLLVHSINGNDSKSDVIVNLPNEPNHQDLCNMQQAQMIRTIQEDIDLSRHNEDAVQSLAICLAADESIRTGKAIDLWEQLK